MVNFLLIIKRIVPFTKKDIDKGNTPLEIYDLCMSLKETFCLSYAIRKLNNLYLYFIEESFFIRFKGEQLRYLGPDERSQAILLNKAINLYPSILEEKRNNWRKSTPGIHVKRISDFFEEFNALFGEMMKFLILKNIHLKETSINLEKELEEITRNSQKVLFILPFPEVEDETMILMKKLERITHVKIHKLSFLSRVSDKILYINYQWDLIEEKTCRNGDLQ